MPRSYVLHANGNETAGSNTLTLLFNCKALPAAQNEQCQLVPQRTLNLRNKQGCQEDTLRSSGKKFSSFKANISVLLYIVSEVIFRNDLTVKVLPNKQILCVEAQKAKKNMEKGKKGHLYQTYGKK